MAKQCPRCWEKVEPGTEVCPNCGYDFVRRAAPGKTEDAEEAPKKRTVVFPTARKKDDDDTNFAYKAVKILTLIWAVLAVIGAVFNMVQGELIQGVGLLVSGILSGLAAYLVMNRRNHGICWLLIILSGAATLRIELLLVGLVISLLAFSLKPYFDDN